MTYIPWKEKVSVTFKIKAFDTRCSYFFLFIMYELLMYCSMTIEIEVSGYQHDSF